MLLQLRSGSAFALMILLCGTGAGTAGKMCVAFSTVGTVVQPGSSFVVYCVFDKKVKCAKTMYLDQDSLQPMNFNATTIFSKFENIRARKTSYEFACKCDCCLVPCGFYLTVGYPPDKPQNLTCIQEGINENISCTWKTGREPYIETSSYILMKTSALNTTLKLSPRYTVNGTAFATLPAFGPNSEYTVWVTTSNKFGNVSSDNICFALSDVARPPAPEITQVFCLSYSCVIHWKVKESSHLQVKCRTGKETRIIDSIAGNMSGNLNVSDLDPFTQYEFQTRNKLDSERGVWSEWSNTVATWTDEEVPLKEIDVWYTEENLHSQEKLYRILWKELHVSEARGVILQYKVMVMDQLTGKSKEIITTSHSVGPIRCSYCNITVYADNSKGLSPAAHIALPLLTVGPSPQNVVCQPISEQGLAISWQKPDTVKPLLGYLVEWFPTDAKSQDIRWRRIAPGDLRTVVKDIASHRCYTGAVYALYAQGVGKEDFQNICSWPPVPIQGPQINLKSWDNATVTVQWKHEGACVTDYTIYLWNRRTQSFEKQLGPVHPSLMEYTTDVLLPGEYDLWMTAWSKAEEGPAGPTHHLFIDFKKKEENLDRVLILTGLFTSITFVLVCLCQIPTVRQRVTVCVQMIHNSIPDPANSRWAKECIAKGQLLPDYKFKGSTVINTEEHSTVEIQEDLEVPVTPGTPGSTSSAVELICSPSTFSQGPSEGRYLNQDKLMHSYIGNSAPVQHDLKPYTLPNVDYIATNSLQNIGSEEEDEEDCFNDFFPCPQDPFMEAMVPCSGQLTLDDLNINCTVFTDLISM